MAENYKLKIDTGAITIPVQDEDGEELGSIKFNPADMDIIVRYQNGIDQFSNIELSNDENLTIEEYKSVCDQIKAIYDYIFAYNVSEVVFAKSSPLTPLKNGEFYCENVLNGMIGIVEKVIDKRIEKKMAKIKKATSKYHK